MSSSSAERGLFPPVLQEQQPLPDSASDANTHPIVPEREPTQDEQMDNALKEYIHITRI